MRVIRVYSWGRGDPPPVFGGWKLSTLEGEIYIRYAEERHDGSFWFLGVLKPIDGGRAYPVEGEVTRTGHVFLTPRAGWAGLV